MQITFLLLSKEMLVNVFFMVELSIGFPSNVLFKAAHIVDVLAPHETVATANEENRGHCVERLLGEKMEIGLVFFK